MAIKAVIGKLEDAPEAIRSNYRAATDADGEALKGKFIFTVDGSDGFALENVEGLKSSLGKERTRAETAENKIKKFGDMDPDAARAAIAKVAEFEGIDPKKEADKLAQVKIDAATTQMAAKHSTEIEAERKKSLGYRDQVQKLLIDNVAIKALEGKKGDVELLLPHVKTQVRLKENDDGSFAVEVVDKDGNAKIGDSQGKPMTVDQLVEEMSKSEKFGRAFEGVGQSGGGQRPGAGGKPAGSAQQGDFGGDKKARIAAIASKFPDLANQ